MKKVVLRSALALLLFGTSAVAIAAPIGNADFANAGQWHEQPAWTFGADNLSEWYAYNNGNDYWTLNGMAIRDGLQSSYSWTNLIQVVQDGETITGPQTFAFDMYGGPDGNAYRLQVGAYGFDTLAGQSFDLIQSISFYDLMPTSDRLLWDWDVTEPGASWERKEYALDFGATGYEYFALIFQAQRSGTALPGNPIAIDNVSVSAAVPEPGSFTIATLLVVMVVLAAARRRKTARL